MKRMKKVLALTCKVVGGLLIFGGLTWAVFGAPVITPLEESLWWAMGKGFLVALIGVAMVVLSPSPSKEEESP